MNRCGLIMEDIATIKINSLVIVNLFDKNAPFIQEIEQYEQKRIKYKINNNLYLDRRIQIPQQLKNCIQLLINIIPFTKLLSHINYQFIPISKKITLDTIRIMSLGKQNQLQMLNEYISALQRQIKSNQGQRQTLIQQVGKLQQNNNKYQFELRQVKNQHKELSTVFNRQMVEKNNLQARMKMLSEENDKLHRQVQARQQRITQLTLALKQRTQQLTKEKNTLLTTTTTHSKQLTIMDDKLKSLQLSLTQLTEQRNLLNYSLQSITEQLNIQKQQTERLKTKNNFCQNYIQTLQGKLKVADKYISEISQQNQGLGVNLNQFNEDLVKAKKDIEELQMKVVEEVKVNEETKSSYEAFIKILKKQHNEECGLMSAENERLKVEVEELKNQIEQKHQTIESVTNALKMEKSTLQKSQQQNTDLSNQLQSLQLQSQHLQQQLLSKQQLILNLQNQSQSWMSKWKRTQDQLQTTLSSKYAKQQQYKSSTRQTEIKHQQQLTHKDDQIDTMTNTINTQALELQQMRYNLGESKKRQERLGEEVRKKCQEIGMLEGELESRMVRIEELTKQVNEREELLETVNKDCQEKGREGEQLGQRQRELMAQVDNLKKQLTLLTKLKQQKQLQNKRLKTKIQSLSQQLSSTKHIQRQLCLKLKQSQTLLTKTLEQLVRLKQAGERKLGQTMKKLNELQSQLERLGRDGKQKQQLVRTLTTQYELKSKQASIKQQQLTKKLSSQQSRSTRLLTRVTQLQHQLQKRQTDFNHALQKLIHQHSTQQHQLTTKHEHHIKAIQNKYFQQANSLNNQLQQKQQQLTNLQNQLAKYHYTNSQLTTNESAMEKTIIMLQQELEEAQREINGYHQKLFSVNASNDKTKELLLEKDIKIIKMTALLDKAKKDNQRLLHQEILLRQQVAALETSTTYLKRQLTSTLQRQQVSLKQIRSLQQANKSYSKLINPTISTSSSKNIPNQSGTYTSRRMQKTKSYFNSMRRPSIKPQLQLATTKPSLELLDEGIIKVEEVGGGERQVVEAERQGKERQLHTNPESSTSIDSSKLMHAPKQQEQQISFSNMLVVNTSNTSSMRNSISSEDNSEK